MKNKLLSSVILLAVTSAFTANAWAYETTYTFDKLDSAKENPETFHCLMTRPAPENVEVKLKNVGEKIAGFNAQGELTLPKGTYNINNVFFKAYHDHDAKFKDQKGYVTITSVGSAAPIICKSGQGHGRTLMPGDFQ